jgi:hypothetical protein
MTPMAILVTGTITGAIALNGQQVYAPRNCGSCLEFKKLTHEFEKNVIGLVGNLNEGPQPHLRELVDAYAQEVTRLFPGQDAVFYELVENLSPEVISIFEHLTPTGDKQAQHDPIKQFRSLIHDFEKAVLGLFTGPE